MKRAIVTGASRGLGLALVRQLLLRGDHVFAGCRTPHSSTELCSLRSQYGNRLVVLPLDVAEQSDIDRAFQAVTDHTGSIDMIINNAGTKTVAHTRSSTEILGSTRNEVLESIDARALEYVFRVNTFGPLLLVQRFLSLLRQGDTPKIINVSSDRASLALKTSGGNYAYCASKAALNMFTRALAFDLEPFGIAVIAIHPGWVRTDLGGPRAELAPDEAAEAVLQLGDRVARADGGRFVDRAGHDLPW